MAKPTVTVASVCCICKKPYEGYGNNPYPLAREGRCCDRCNFVHVLPARLMGVKPQKSTREEILSWICEHKTLAEDYERKFGVSPYEEG